MNIRLLFLCAILSIASIGFSQNDAMEDIDFLIVYSSKNYNSAKAKAEEISRKIPLELNLRTYYHDSINGGLITKIECGCGEIHDYTPRGRFDDGNYISIEFTTGYENFTNGYYIVVAASWSKGNKEMDEVLFKIKKTYKTAYVKKSAIYMGCMH